MRKVYFKLSENKNINKVILLCLAELKRYGFDADTYESENVSPAISICFDDKDRILVTPAFKEFFTLFAERVNLFYWSPEVITATIRDRIYAKIVLPKYFQALFMTERGRISFAVFFVSIFRKYYDKCI